MLTRYKIVFFDLDGVLADYESSWGFVHNYFGANNDANVQAYFRGEIDDYEFMRRDIAIWKSYKPDIKREDVKQILRKIPIMPNAVEMIQTLRDENIIIVILSGGLELLAQRISERVKIDYIFANGLLFDDSGNLGDEGVLNVPLIHKEHVMLKLLEYLNIPASETSAVGDSRVDAEMLKLANLGIAFCPIDEIVTQNADVVIKKKDSMEILKYLL